MGFSQIWRILIIHLSGTLVVAARLREFERQRSEARMRKRFVIGKSEPRSENSRRNLHTQKVAILIIIKSM